MKEYIDFLVVDSLKVESLIGRFSGEAWLCS